MEILRWCSFNNSFGCRQTNQVYRNQRKDGWFGCVSSRSNGESYIGNGDVISLVERAQQQFDEEEARKCRRKLQKNQFGFDDFLSRFNKSRRWVM